MPFSKYIPLMILLATAAPAQLTFGVASTGPTSLTYGGRSYWYNRGNFMDAYTMTTPGGAATRYFQPACTATSDNSTYVQCVYRSGSSDSATLRLTYAVQGSNTLQATMAVTNNDSTNTLSLWNIAPFWLTVGSDTITTATPQNVNLQNNAAFFVAGTFGSLAIWHDYSYAAFDIKQNTWTTGTQSPTLVTHRTVGVDDYSGLLQTYDDNIAPGVTHTYVMWLRFGTVDDSVSTLAPEAGNLFSGVYPTLLSYPDRRRIGLWFMSEGAYRSATNPRGYLAPGLNALDPTTLAAALAAKTSAVIATAKTTMVPAAQGILFWDVEGAEFLQSFSYVGAPNRLADIAPEMDAAIDTAIASIRAAGLKVGFTLRPQHFLSGTSLPGTCNYYSTPTAYGYEYDDVFVNTTAYTYPSSTRWAACQVGTNTWTYDSNNGGGFQTGLQSLSATQAEVEAKAQYAITRWGASFFYVDSVAYEGGSPYAVSMWRNLQALFPTILFIPEQEVLGTFTAAAPYGQPSEGLYRNSDTIRQQVPGSFRYIASNDFPTGHETEMQAGAQNGDLYANRAWVDDTANIVPMNALYAAAAVDNTSLLMVDSATGRNHSFSGKPDNYTYPLMLRVYFGTSASNVAVSNTYCQKQAAVSCYVAGVLQPGSSIDLHTFTHYGVTYADFTGARVTGWSIGTF